MGERQQLVELVATGVAVAHAAELFGVSRKTAHKWINRAKERGLVVGLDDMSRARHRQPRFGGRGLDLLLSLRRDHPTWGPRTLLYALQRREPKLKLPAASTVGEILKREGLIHPRTRQARFAAPFSVGDKKPIEPNDRWTGDYKGQFRMRNGRLCYPLTLRDHVSRKLIDVRGFERVMGADVIERLIEAFKQCGLPEEFHTDTGSPFASHGLARLAPVSVFLLKHGVRPVYSRPAKPQDNGGHERMHRDLKVDVARSLGTDLRDQQRKFDAFRAVFNNERPHHALGGDMPATRWHPSTRTYRPNPIVSYPKHWEVRLVSAGGDIHWRGAKVNVTKALQNEPVGLEPLDEGLWRVHFTRLLCIGIFHEQQQRVFGFRPERRGGA